jgi:hypothetical protein
MTHFRNDLAFLDTVIAHQMAKACLPRVEAVQAFRAVVFKEMSVTAFDAIGMLSRQLIPASRTIEEKVHYLTMQADMYRYVCEFIEEGQKWEPSNAANEKYEEAIQMARMNLAPQNALLLGAVMNFTVFTAQILGQKTEAIAEARKAVELAKEAEEYADYETSREARVLLELMQKNIEMWEKSSEWG